MPRAACARVSRAWDAMRCLLPLLIGPTATGRPLTGFVLVAAFTRASPTLAADGSVRSLAAPSAPSRPAKHKDPRPPPGVDRTRPSGPRMPTSRAERSSGAAYGRVLQGKL